MVFRSAALHERFDRIVIGGAMANTFLKAMDLYVGRSRLDGDSVSAAGRLIAICGDKLIVPDDVIAAETTQADAQHRAVSVHEISSEWTVVDIGPRSREMILRLVAGMNTVVWNGSMGVAELPPFSRGTRTTAQALAGADTLSVVGGGDTVAALHQFGLSDPMSHVSTGGGAFLDFLAGRKLPGIEALAEA